MEALSALHRIVSKAFSVSTLLLITAFNNSFVKFLYVRLSNFITLSQLILNLKTMSYLPNQAVGPNQLFFANNLN